MSKIIKSFLSGLAVTIGVFVGTKLLIMLGLGIESDMIGKIITPVVFFGSSIGFYIMGIIYDSEAEN